MILSMLDAPVMAQNLDSQAFEAQVFHSETAQPVQLSELSAQEMKETEGAALPLAAGILMGGAIGAWSNHDITKLRTGRFASTRSTLAATAGGMIGGGYSNLMLRGAGIATNPFKAAAWNRSNRVGNVVIRGNGAALSSSYGAAMGKYHRK